MKLNYFGKNVNITDDLKEMTEKKLAGLDKYFSKDPDTTVTFEKVKNDFIVDVTIRIPKTIFRAEQSSESFQTSLDRCVDSLVSQIRRHKTKLQKRYQDTDTIRFDQVENVDESSEDDEIGIARVKEIPVKPMNAEEAVLQMDLLNHNFFVYLDDETNEVNVVYKRKKGGYGLIIPTR